MQRKALRKPPSACTASNAVLMVLAAAPMMIGALKMVHTLSIWLLVAAFLGAGLFNVIGTPATKSDFARWGYPRWWNILTGGLEMTSAVLIALPVSRILGLALGAVIIAAGVLTVLRHRDFSHLAPLGVFVALIAFAATST